MCNIFVPQHNIIYNDMRTFVPEAGVHGMDK